MYICTSKTVSRLLGQNTYYFTTFGEEVTSALAGFMQVLYLG